MFVGLLVVASLAGGANTLPTNTADGINEFSIRLLDIIAAEQDGNFVTSSVSVWNLFSLLAEGAAGTTFEELAQRLDLPRNPKLSKELHATVNEILRKNYTEVDLKRSGSMYVEHNLGVHADFVDIAARTYDVDAKEVDTRDVENVANVINYDVCVGTEGVIRNVVKKEELENLVMLLVDAVYFKANWTNEFDPKFTEEEDFFDDKGKKAGRVNMMFQKTDNYVSYIDDISARAIKLPYGPDKQFSMTILLPYEGISLQKFIKDMTAFSVKKIMDSFIQYSESSPVDCFIPRFKISSDLDLKQPLKYMGIVDIFESERASLPGISNSPLYVSKVLQKAQIEVTEEGTTAAAATVLGLENRILGSRFEVNKPFVFFISENESNLVLFSGVYSNPSLV